MLPNVSQLLAETSRRQPHQAAILGPGLPEALSYSQLDQAVSVVSQRLQSAGLKPGDSVGLHCRSGVSYIIATYAVWRCGGNVTPIAVELTPPEKQTILHTIALSWLLTQAPPRTASFAAGMIAGDGIDVAADLTLMPLEPQRPHPDAFSGVNCAFLRFTSGTTGSAKGVVLSHETIVDRIHAANDVLHIGPADRVIWLLSMSYHFTVSIVAYLSFGAAVVLPANHLATGIVDAARRHQATVIYGSPVHYRLMASAQTEPLTTLRLAVSTTTALEPQTAVRFRQRFGVPITQALGIIEIGLPFINSGYAGDKPTAIGQVLPAYRLQLEEIGLSQAVSAEMRAKCGEILLAGKGFLDAYYEPWRPRHEIMPDGWFRTGDVAEMDGDGCLFLRGRKKDMIDVLGMKFFPQEVEAVLMAHERVEAARVFSRPDSRLGEIVQAQVVLRADAPATQTALRQELLDWCKKRLAAFKVPQHLEFTNALPQTASGKVLHRHVPLPGGGT